MKICIRCKETKPLAKFENHPTAKDGKRNQCSSCRHAIRLARDPNYRNKQREWNLGRYGITLKEYEEMFNKQNQSCAICEGKDFGKHNKPFVDHDHLNGKVRGLLCINCNTLLGNAKDSPEILRAALAYLGN